MASSIVFSLVLMSAFSAALSYCPEGINGSAKSLYHGNYVCYAVISARSSWNDVHERCQSNNGWSIAMPRTREQVAAVREVLTGITGDAWIGIKYNWSRKWYVYFSGNAVMSTLVTLPTINTFVQPRCISAKTVSGTIYFDNFSCSNKRLPYVCEKYIDY